MINAAESPSWTENAKSSLVEKPNYRIGPDGEVDWYTYNGFRRYHAECHVCHGPDGEGSTFAPSLLSSLRIMSYSQFRDIIIRGSRSVGAGEQKVMRAMGDDPNVVCYLEDLYVYLKARADGALDRGRPRKYEPKPGAVKDSEATCMKRN
jgi:methanol metabolism-related c-type cytochrome